MKTKQVWGIVLLLCMSVGFTHCKEEEPTQQALTPFKLDKQSYEVMRKGYKHIAIVNGSGELGIEIAEPAILDAKYSRNPEEDFGILRIEGKEKGETTLTVTDLVTKETVTVAIKVTDIYLAYEIRESNHPALDVGTVVYLVNNERKDCYFFHYADTENKLPTLLNAKGTYRFSVRLEQGTEGERNVPYMTLIYPSDEKGHFTDAAIAPIEHPFRLELQDGATNINVVNIIQHYLGVNWEELISNQPYPRTNVMKSPTLKMTVDETDFSLTGTLDILPSMPEGILE